MPSTAEWKELESKYYMFLVRRQPMVLEKGDGARVWDVDGKEYLDFTSGWAVNNAGHSNPVIAEAIAEQAKTLVQTSNQFYTIPQLKLAEILVENSCLDKIFICNIQNISIYKINPMEIIASAGPFGLSPSTDQLIVLFF